MKTKNIFMISLFIIIMALIGMGINLFISPLADTIVRVIGIIMLIDLFVLSYSTVKLKSISK